jgi:hypoxanthine phosphoribosyltransferase
MAYENEHVDSYLTAAQIAARTAELGAEITAQGATVQPLVVICVLKGSVLFFADLVRHIQVPTNLVFLGVSSYGGNTESSGAVRLTHDLTLDIAGRDVLIVEDIVDSGLTLSWIRSNLESRSAASVEILTLLRKPDAAKVQVDVKYVGFDIPNEFVVGYGLDYAEKYRNLRDVGTLAPHVYT